MMKKIFLLLISLLVVINVNAAPNGKPFQNLEEQIEALEEQVNANQQAIEVTVDCYVDSITDILNTYANSSAHLTINVHGMCLEDIVLPRDNIHIRGDINTSGPHGIQAVSIGVTANGVQRINLDSLDIYGGSQCRGNSGLIAWANASVELNNVNISCFSHGVAARGGYVQINNSTITNNRRGVRTQTNGTVRIFDSDISDNRATGIIATRNSVALVTGTSISRNGIGISIERGGNVDAIGGNSLLNNNIGIEIKDFGVLRINNTEISGSSEEGISCSGILGLRIEGGMIFSGNVGGDISPLCP